MSQVCCEHFAPQEADGQTLVSSILLKVHPDTHETILSPRSIGRHRVEMARSAVLGHIRRRWLQIRDQGGFSSLENWSIKEIADGTCCSQLPFPPSRKSRPELIR